MKLIPSLLFLSVLFEISWSYPYPIFGTKRYHRANVISPVMAAPVPVYTNLPQYYDSAQPSYSVPYSNDDNYFYYPSVIQEQPPQEELHPSHHSSNNNNYRTYGMPTYRGEYKPQPYYYAHGPVYNYYEDHIESNNPLDDLHEEMLQEDERERQRDTLPIGQETWYENIGRDQSLANANAAFLRNLIAYNKQLNAAKEQQERLQQQQQQQLQSSQPEFGESGEEFDDYMNDEENYDQQIDQPSLYYNNQQIPNDEVDDENVRELKSLVANHKNIPSNQNNNLAVPSSWVQSSPDIKKYSNDNNNFHQHVKHHVNFDVTKNKNNNPFDQTSSVQQYDEPEYDDSWINWDKKRSIYSPSKKDQSIYTFSDRKPHYENSKILTTLSPVQSTINPPITTTKTSPPIDKLEESLKNLSGQKEIVLPRPAGLTRHPFPSMLNFNTLANSGKGVTNEKSEDETKRGNKNSVYDTIKQLLALEHHHEKINQPQLDSSRLQKRFISNEESLVQELNGLKRISV